MSEVSQDQSPVQASDFEAAPLKIDSGSVGGRLASTREERGWTVQYVAEQLKLSQSQILALEADQLDKLPKLVIVRGFVRAYAKLLRIDGDSLVSLLPQDAEPVKLEASLRPALSTPFVESRTSLSGHQENNRRYIVGMLVLLIFVAIVVVLQRTELGSHLQSMLFGGAQKTSEISSAPNVIDQVMEPASVAVVSAQASAPEAMHENTVALSAPASSSVASSVAQETVVAQNVVQSPGSSPVSPLNSVATSAASTGVVADSTINSPISANESLTLRFKQDSWVFVKAENGAVLSSHLAKAGTEEVFSVKQALFVKLGNAAGVEASVRGKPFAIVLERDSKVASFSVK